VGGLAATQRFARLFMFPGMYHCFGGTGPYSFDLLTHCSTGSRAAPRPSASMPPCPAPAHRPVFPYPLVARYDGTGSTDDAANFTAAQPANPVDDHFPWLGRFE
jgi:feruloyl esterase